MMALFSPMPFMKKMPCDVSSPGFMTHEGQPVLSLSFHLALLSFF
jgi:hypothetical protein